MTEHEQHHCRVCNAELIEPDNWSPSRARKKDRICRSCVSSQNKEWRKQNPDKHREHAAKWYKQNQDKKREYNREYNLKQKYGIDEAEWNSMFEAQGGRCAICDSPDPKGNHGVFHVDHCHSTGKVRGLLCDTCNRGLGFFYDNKNFLKSAIEYLEVHE